MKYFRLFLFAAGFALLTLLPSQPISAQTTTTTTTTADLTQVDISAIPKLAQTISAWIRTIGYAAAVGTIIYAGILYLNSKGSESNASTAKNAIRAAITGLAIIILSEVLVRTTLGFVTRTENQTGINSILHQ